MRRLSKGLSPIIGLFAYALVCFCSPVLAQNDSVVVTAVQRAKEVGVEEDILNYILVLGYKYHLKPAEVSEFINITRVARSENLPMKPLVSKMEEGLAKRVKVETIQKVVRQELSRYRFVRGLSHKAMNRWNLPDDALRSEDLVRLVKTMSLGISEKEMEGFFETIPRVSLSIVANVIEFSAALRQSGLGSKATEDIVLSGLGKGYFTRSAWSLALLVKAAKGRNTSDERIKSAALDVVRGNQSIEQAQRALGIGDKDLSVGPQVISPSVAPPEAGSGPRGGEGESGSSGSGSEGGGSDGGAGAGGAGSEGNGPGGGSGGPGDGAGGGGGHR